MCNSLGARSDYNRRALRGTTRRTNFTLNEVDKWSVHVVGSYVVHGAKLTMRPNILQYTPRSENYVAQTIRSADTDEFGLGAQANDNL